MKLAVSNLAWPLSADEAVANVLRAEGVTGVELAPGKVWAKAPRVPAGEAEQYTAGWLTRGCDVVAFQAILFGRAELSIFADGDLLAATQDHLVAMGRLAERCGARVLVLGAPGNRKRGQRSMDSAVAVAARALRPVAVALEGSGVRLCIEPNPPRYGCDFVNTAAEAAVLCEAVGHANFGIHLDSAALALSGELTEGALGPVMKHVRHVHISEVDLAPVGSTATVPHAQLGATLRALHYTGWYSIEMRVGEEDAWHDALPRAIATARGNYG
jgi:sugar phosphate isomerase/epimerase